MRAQFPRVKCFRLLIICHELCISCCLGLKPVPEIASRPELLERAAQPARIFITAKSADRTRTPKAQAPAMRSVMVERGRRGEVDFGKTTAA